MMFDKKRGKDREGRGSADQFAGRSRTISNIGKTKRFADFKSYHRVKSTPNGLVAGDRPALSRQGRNPIGKVSAQKIRQKLKKSSLRRRRFIAGGLIGIIVLAFFGLTYVNFSPEVKIESQQSSSLPVDSITSSGSVEAYAAKLLKESLLNHNKLTINTGSLEAKLAAAFPELSDIKLEIDLFGAKPKIVARQSQPIAVYSSGGGASSVLLDSRGYAIGNYEVRYKSLLKIEDQSNQAAKLGSQILPSAAMVLAQKLKFQLSNHSAEIDKIVLPVDNSYELDLYVRNRGYFVKFDMRDEDSFDQQIGSYLALAKHFASHNIKPSQYADVRLLGRAYYK